MSTETNKQENSQDQNLTESSEQQLDDVPKENSQEENVNLSSDDNLEKKVQDLEEKLIRSIAEIENTRNRYSKQLQDSAKFALSGFVKQLVNVFENFFRIIDNAPKNEIAKNEAFNSFFVFDNAVK